jgi:hypothetical protein
MATNLDNVYRYIAAGFARMDFHVLDSKGLPAGITGTVTADNVTGVSAGRILAAVTAAINTPAPTPVGVPGDNTLQGTFQFPSDQPRSFQLDFSADDFTNRQAFQNIKKRDIGNHTFAGRDTQPFTLNNVMILGTSNASSKADNAGRGLGMYGGVFSTRAQISIQGRQSFANRAAALYLAFVTLNAMNAYPWGETFVQAVEGYTESFIEDWTARYPVAVTRWTGLSAKSKIYLPEQPASTDINDCLIYSIDANGNTQRQTAGITISQSDNSISFGTPYTAVDTVAYFMRATA